MLVRSVRSFTDYTGTRTINKGRHFIVYAIEHINDEINYYVIPYGISHTDNQYDPLAFPSDYFEIVADLVTKDWAIRELGPDHFKAKVKSFPEWLEGDFHVSAHDWDLEDNDYKVIQKYKRAYEELYKSYIEY